MAMMNEVCDINEVCDMNERRGVGSEDCEDKKVNEKNRGTSIVLF